MCEVRLSVNDIRKSIKEMLEDKRPQKCVSIYKAPLVLTEKNKEAYIPKWVSVGPYHHKAPHLSSYVFTQKVTTVHRFMSRVSSPDKPNMSTFDKIVKKVKKSEIKIRESYATDIEYDGEYLACMMALDGCFVLEIIRCLSDNEPNPDPFFNRHNIEYANYSLLTDILLLENQIPLFVLIKLLKLETKPDTDARRKLSQMLIYGREVGRLFYPFIFKNEDWSSQVDALIRSEEPKHILDLLFRLARGGHTQSQDAATEGKGKYRCFSIPCKQKQISKVEETDSIPTVTELIDAGIHIEPYEGDLTGASFSNEKSTLKLPKINVSAAAGIFLRNLMAYEICQSPDKRIICNFAVLMDELINTDKDVALLRKKGVIYLYTLGSDNKVALFFNDLRKGTVAAGSTSIDTFRDLRDKVIRCYRSKYRVLFAEFVRVHFSKPWRAASAAAAVVLLILTFLQTIYTLKAD